MKQPTAPTIYPELSAEDSIRSRKIIDYKRF